MTIDEAIKHCEEKAEEQEYVSQIIVELHHEESEREHKAACDACAANHRQLAEWLTELKALKAADAQLKDVIRRIYIETTTDHYGNAYVTLENIDKILTKTENMWS